MRLPAGKIPIDILKEVVFKNLGVKRSEVILGPAAGVDGAVLEVGTKNAYGTTTVFVGLPSDLHSQFCVLTGVRKGNL